MFLEKEKFALWVDFIERDFIENGLKELVEKKIVNGATSNPAIFKNAFLTSSAYKEEIKALKGTMPPKEIYETLAIKDIQAAADVLRPLFDANDDGFVSIEVDPTLANDAQATIDEGMRLHKMIARPNVMIKVPATDAGYIAMQELVALGISVNATLIFSLTEALSCCMAFKKGQAKTSQDVHTVVSVFVSRVDRKLDSKLAKEYQAQAGIMNAAMIYNNVEKLAVKNNRTLFASTGVKGDTLHPAYYVSELIAFNTVNTTPLDTIDAYVKEGSRELKLPIDQKDMDAFFQHLTSEGIVLNEVLLELKAEGLQAFEEAFEEIMQSLQG